MTEQMHTKTGENLNKIIAARLEECYIQLGKPIVESSDPFLRGSIKAYEQVLLRLGYHAELEVKIVEDRK